MLFSKAAYALFKPVVFSLIKSLIFKVFFKALLKSSKFPVAAATAAPVIL
jgi:hypothetical protein